MSLEIKIFKDADAVASAAALDLVDRVSQVLTVQSLANIVVTGGTVGILTLAKLAQIDAEGVDWARVHVWWGDERFVESKSPYRNAVQASEAWLAGSKIPESNIHQFPAADNNLSLENARDDFDQLLQKYASPGLLAPIFDVLLLGMGPDGHIASLFPGKPEIPAGTRTVAEKDSPKPPPQRLSFSYELINSAKEVWFTIAGADKADAVSVAFSPNKASLPVGRVSGTQKTIWILDEAAASEIGKKN